MGKKRGQRCTNHSTILYVAGLFSLSLLLRYTSTKLLTLDLFWRNPGIVYCLKWARLNKQLSFVFNPYVYFRFLCGFDLIWSHKPWRSFPLYPVWNLLLFICWKLILPISKSIEFTTGNQNIFGNNPSTISISTIWVPIIAFSIWASINSSLSPTPFLFLLNCLPFLFHPQIFPIVLQHFCFASFSFCLKA